MATGQNPPFTKDYTDRAVAIMNSAPHEDCADSVYTSGSPQALTGGVEYDWDNDCLGFSDIQYPYYMTEIFNTTDSKIYLTEENDAPNYVANLRFTFDPTSASAGKMTFRAYIDDTVPILIRSVQVDYKGVAEDATALITFYIGALIKTKGLKFTYEPDQNGNLYDRSHYLYRT